MPKVSVIMPAYNVETCICEAIDSVLAQTYQDFEIIVIDDGSNDNTRRILDQYAAKIKYIYQENKGVSAARNRGIREAQGEYVAFLDADDIWFADKLMSQITIAQQNSDISLFFSDAEVFNDGGRLETSLRPPNASLYDSGSLGDKIVNTIFNDGSIIKGNFFESLFMRNLVLTSTVFVRRECLVEAGCFDESIKICEDYDLYLRISRTHALLYFNKVMVRYRFRDDSLSGKVSLRNIFYREHVVRVLERSLCHCSKSYQDLVIKTRILQGYRIAIWGYFNLREFNKVRKLCLCSLSYNGFQVKIYLYLIATFFPAVLIRPKARLES